MSKKKQAAPVPEERAHAILSASSAKRWLACTPSARFEDQYPDESSTYAEEGTAAHALADAILSADPAAEERARQSPYYNAAMEEYIRGYVDFVQERFNAAKAATPDAILFTEQRLDYHAWVPEGFGTGDVIIIGAGRLEIIDLKYGAGVPVQAEDNPQIKLYGAGAWAAFDMLYDIEEVQTTICQPRLDSITTCVIDTADLLKWLETEVAPKAQDAWDGTGEYAPGDHCHFCRALPHCRALADYNLELAKYEFKKGEELDNEDIADILGRSETLKKWAGKIAEYALNQAVNHGVKFTGWKLVEGRSNRKYTDPDAVANALLAEGYPEAILYTHDLLGLTAMEQAIGKKTFNTLLTGLVEKAPGAPTLAPEKDKRPEIGSTQGAKTETEDGKAQ